MMKLASMFVIIAAVAGTGCKKKDEGAPGAAAKSSDKTADKAPDKAPDKAGDKAAPATGVKSCEELGGTPDTTRTTPHCSFKGPAPFDVTFTGKYDSNMMNPEPGAIFKVTSKFDRPVQITSAQIYAYDKAGKQIEFVVGAEKVKYAQDSGPSMLEIAPGETGELRHSMGPSNMPPDMDTLQLEIIAWYTPDGKNGFSHNLETGQDEVRPKDGWK